MEKDLFNKILIVIIFLSLLILTFLILKPILVAIILGFLLAYIFSPLYKFVYKLTKVKSFSATIIVILLILIIVVPFWFLVPILIKESFKFYLSIQSWDISSFLQQNFASLFPNNQFPTSISSTISSFISKTTNSLVNYFSSTLFNLPLLLLDLLIMLFTFFFVLRDKEKITSYIKSILPFPKEIQKKFFEYSNGITYSVLYGQVIIGILQGLIAGLGFIIFGVPNALLWTILAVIAGILPIIGPVIAYLPVIILLLLAGETFSAIGVLAFGTIASNIDNFLRPLIVSKNVDLHPALVLISMAGGVFVFGILGFILGPLVLSYLIIILEIYRDKKNEDNLNTEKKEE